MQVFHSIKEWLAFRAKLPTNDLLGFVPTMGNLHYGHQSLMAQSQNENQHTVVSIFVNPTQFNQASDFEHYPRTVEADLDLLNKQGIDFCLIPTVQEMYPDDYSFNIQEMTLSTCLEGKHRPGHFDGVLTVVMKLLHLVQPHQLYLGEKDYQQFQLLQEMVRAFFIPVKLKLCSTVREKTGLAYSSRNNRLSAEEREIAESFAAIFHQEGLSCETIAEQLKQQNIIIDYLEEHQGRRFVAVKIGGIRLIDNYALNP